MSLIEILRLLYICAATSLFIFLFLIWLSTLYPFKSAFDILIAFGMAIFAAALWFFIPLVYIKIKATRELQRVGNL